MTATGGTRPAKLTIPKQTKANLVEFSKYEGLGNDFILIDDRERDAPSLTPEQSVKLCDRNFGVGADGVIFALKPPSGEYDFTMRIYNSDGSEPEMCGNGIRCFAQFLKDLGAEAESYRVNTLAGAIIPVLNDDGTITVDMGTPELVASKVPTTLEPNFEGDSVVEQTLECNGKTWKVSAVSMGNPHAVIFVEDLEKDIDFRSDGPALESCKAFPARTNVEFVQVLSDTHLKMKVSDVIVGSYPCFGFTVFSHVFLGMGTRRGANIGMRDRNLRVGDCSHKSRQDPCW